MDDVAARTGAQLMQALKEAPMALWHRERKVPDITTEEGLVSLIIDAVGQHVQDKLAEIRANLETMKAFRRAAAAGD